MEMLDAGMSWVREYSMILSSVALLFNLILYQIVRYKVRSVIKEADQRKMFFKKEDIMKSIGYIFMAPLTLVAISHMKTDAFLHEVNVIIRWVLFFMYLVLAFVCYQSLSSTMKIFSHRYRKGDYIPEPTEKRTKSFRSWLGF